VSGPAGLPPGLVAYRRTPVFNEASIPAGLRREHRTKPGVWAVISVLEGRLRFRALPAHSDPTPELSVSAGGCMVVSPEQPHEVKPEGSVRFFVEFYRTADAGGAGERTGADNSSRGL
jgi:tellurite resistance-related uncharacterized protein